MVRIKLSRTPPSTQHIYFHKGHMVFMSSEGKQCKELFQWEMKSQYKGKIITDPISVIVEYYFKDKRKHDIDNFSKLWLDAGTGILWKDDGQIVELVLRKFIDTKNSRTEIIII